MNLTNLLPSSMAPNSLRFLRLPASTYQPGFEPLEYESSGSCRYLVHLWAPICLLSLIVHFVA